MSFTLKTDVKVHFSNRGRTQNLPQLVLIQPNATDLSGAVGGESRADSSRFDSDFIAEHSTARISIVPAIPLTGSIGANEPDVPGSPQE